MIIPALPASGPRILLRALCKRGGTASPASAVSTHYQLAACDTATLHRYNALIGYPAAALPLTFYYLLAQRAQLATMLRPEFPLRVLGLIHVENAIEEEQPLVLSQPLHLLTEARLETDAHDGARYCVLRTTAQQNDATAFVCTSRYLAVRGKRAAGGARPAPAAPAGELLGEWPLAASAGRAYAAVSGDWNPIHLWTWSARLLGMKSPIIHGMQTVAKACAELERVHARRVRSVTAAFKAVIPLGAQAALWQESGSSRYQVVCRGRIAVAGEAWLEQPAIAPGSSAPAGAPRHR